MTPVLPIVPLFLAILIRAAGARIVIALASASLSFAARTALSLAAARLRTLWFTSALPRIAMMYAASYPVAAGASRLASGVVGRGGHLYDTRSALTIFLSIVDTLVKKQSVSVFLSSVVGATLLKFWQWAHMEPGTAALVSRLLASGGAEAYEAASTKLQQIATLSEAIKDERLSERERSEIQTELSSQRQQYDALMAQIRSRETAASSAFTGTAALSFSSVGVPSRAQDLLWQRIGTTAQASYSAEAARIVNVMRSWVEVVEGKIRARTAELISATQAASTPQHLSISELEELIRGAATTSLEHVMLSNAKIDLAFFHMLRETYAGGAGDRHTHDIARALALADYFTLNPALFNPYGTYAESWDQLTHAIESGAGFLPSGF